MTQQHRVDERGKTEGKTLVSGYATLAELLMLPEKDEQDQAKVVDAVKTSCGLTG
jgi:hypothetical protein